MPVIILVPLSSLFVLAALAHPLNPNPLPSSTFTSSPSMSWLGKLSLPCSTRAGASTNPSSPAMPHSPDDDAPSPGKSFTSSPSMSWLGKLSLPFSTRAGASANPSSPAMPHSPDDDAPSPGKTFAQFGAGCFWGVELAFQRVSGVTKTEVGYSQGALHEPTYQDICTGSTNHSEVIRVQYDPAECGYDDLLDAFWARHDPTTLNRQGNDVGTQYRSGIYFYTPEQEKSARESMEKQQHVFNRKIVTEILPAKKFYRAEEYHQQYLEKGGRFGFQQSATKGCNDPIRCYG